MTHNLPPASADPGTTTIGPVDALLVVDVQRGFFEGPEAIPDHAAVAEAVALLLRNARAAGAPIVFLQNDGSPGTVDEPDGPGWALLHPAQPGEMVVRKREDDGFHATGLDAVLTESRARRLALCGVLSEMCVAATARAALERGYGVVLPHDAHGTYHVPAGPGSDGVPAAMAARAAEWSLGDAIEICATAAEVRFGRAVRP